MKTKSTIVASMFAGLFPALAPAADPAWFSLLGSNPVLQDSMRRQLSSEIKAVAALPDPTQYPADENWQPRADACSAFVNIYKLSGDMQYAGYARQIADWLLASNDYLVAHADPSFSYLGWGPQVRTGYYKCSDVGSYHADDAWDTGAALRCLLKYSEIDPAGPSSIYRQRATQILDKWPYLDHASYDGNPATPQLAADASPFAVAGMRWYMKSNEVCENRYVKNTNIQMGEQYFRAYRLTQNPNYLQAGMKVLDSQLWDIVSHGNFAYDSFMIYDDQSDPSYADMVNHNEPGKVVHTDPGQPDDTIRCKYPDQDSSCWNHLGFEAFDMYLVQQLTRNLDSSLFPVPGTADTLAQALAQTMSAYRASFFGNTSQFIWDANFDSPTHVTAYNCAQRFAADPSYLSECIAALNHKPSGSTIFYSLVPDGMFTDGPAH